jgi:hypothetical protein
MEDVCNSVPSICKSKVSCGIALYKDLGSTAILKLGGFQQNRETLSFFVLSKIGSENMEPWLNDMDY